MVMMMLFMMVNNNLVGGIPTPLKNMKVSWDDDIPNMMGKIKFMFQTTNQIVVRSFKSHPMFVESPWEASEHLSRP